MREKDINNNRMERNLEILFAEYELIEGIAEKYFSYMYLCINFTFVFYGAAIAIFHRALDMENGPIITFVVFLYLLPISTYVLGLFYAYNAVAISKVGLFMIKIENDLAVLCQRLHYIKHLHYWNTFAREYPGGNVVAYGTMLAFYIGLPIASIAFGNASVDFSALGEIESVTFFIDVLPWYFFIVYVSLMSILIYQMYFFLKLSNSERNVKLLDYTSGEM